MNRRLLKRVAVGGVLLVGTGVALVIAGVAFLTTNAGNELVRRQALSLLGPLVPGGSVELDGLRFNLVSALELDGLRLKDSAGVPIISLDHLALDYDLSDALDRRLNVSRLTLERPQVAIQAGADGQLNLLVALGIGPSPPSTEAPTPWSGLPGVLQIDVVSIVDADIHYVDGTTDLHLEGLDLDAGLTIDHGDLDLRDLKVTGDLTSPARLPLSLDGDLALTDDTLVVQALRAGLGATRLSVDGGIGHAQTAPALNLDTELLLTPADLTALAGQEVTRQELRGAIKLDGPLSALVIEGDLEAPAGRLAVQGRVDLEAEPLAWQIQVATPGLALHELVAAVTEETRLAGRYSLLGTGTGWPDLPGQTDPDLIRASVRIDGEDQVLWGEPLKGLVLEAKIDAGRVEISRLSGRAAVGSARLTGSVDVPAGTADLTGDLSLPDLSALSRYGVEGLAGAADWSGSASVRWGEPKLKVLADGTLTAHGLSAPGGVGVGELSIPLDVQVDGEAVTGSGELSLAGLSAPGVSVEQTRAGWTVRREESGALAVDITGLDLVGLSAPDADVQLGGATGQASLILDSAGAPEATFNLVLTDLALPTGVTASGPVSGGVLHDAVSATLDLRSGERPVLGGALKGDLAGGPWVINDLVLGPTPDALWTATETTTFTLADGGARDLVLAMRSEVGALSARGDLVPSALNATVQVEALDLAWLSALALRFDKTDPLAGLEGAANAKLSFHSAGARLDAHANLSLDDLVMPGAVDAPIHLDLQLALKDDLLRVEGSLDRTEDRWVSLGADVPVHISPADSGFELRCGEPIAARMIAGPLSAEKLSAVVPSVEGTFEQLSADLSLRGDVCDPDVALAMATTTRAADPERVLRADLRVARGASDLNLRGGVELDGARRVQLDGRAQTAMSEVMAWVFRGAAEPEVSAPSTWVSALELNAVPLAVPLSVLGAPSSLSGTLVGGLQASGELDDLQLAGGLQWMDGRLGNVALSLGYFGLEPVEDGYQLTTLLGFPEGGGLELTGFIPMRIDLGGDITASIDSALSDNRLNLKISDGNGGPARLPLEALIAGQSGFSEAKGDLELSGQVGGSLSDPNPELELGLYGGAITVASTAVRYDDITVNASVLKDQIRLRDLAVHTRPRYGAVLKPGLLAGAGEISLEGFSPREVSLSLHMDDFWASATSDLSLSMTGDLATRGPWPELTLSGDLALSQARIVRSRDSFLDNASFTLNPDIEVTRAGVGAARAQGEVPELWEGFALDLDLDLNRNLTLHVEMPTSTDYGKQFADLSSVTLDADLDGDLNVTGRAGAPVLRGVIETVRGDVLLLGSDFNLMPEGEISFAGGDYDNPILNLQAVRATDGYGDVHAYITQHVADIKVDFKADDYPDPADAMALILSGRPSSELTSSEGDAGAVIASMAMASLSGEIERAVGLSALDQFEIDPTSSAVRVGKALADNLFLSLQFQQVGTDDSENTAQATVEWMIRRKLYAEFVTGDAGKSSADLYWRWRF